MNQSQIIRDALGALRPANTFSVPTDNPYSTKVLMLESRLRRGTVLEWFSL